MKADTLASATPYFAIITPYCANTNDYYASQADVQVVCLFLFTFMMLVPSLVMSLLPYISRFRLLLFDQPLHNHPIPGGTREAITKG